MDDLKSTVLSAQQGDAAAYGTLVARFQDMAYGYAYALLGDFELAQDAAQEAFIEGYRCSTLSTNIENLKSSISIGRLLSGLILFCPSPYLQVAD